MKKLVFKAFFLFALSIFTTSCTTEQKNVHKKFLNYKYILREAGDLHGINPIAETSVERNPGYSSYKKLFDLKNSFINFQCKGDSFDNYHCETTLVLKDADGNSILEYLTPFNSSYTGGYEQGTLLYDNESLNSNVETIYVYTPYWVRFQLKYDVKKDGNMTLLTFEFWKQSYNDVPIWE